MKIILLEKSVLYYSTFILGIRQWQNVWSRFSELLDMEIIIILQLHYKSEGIRDNEEHSRIRRNAVQSF